MEKIFLINKYFYFEVLISFSACFQKHVFSAINSRQDLVFVQRINTVKNSLYTQFVLVKILFLLNGCFKINLAFPLFNSINDCIVCFAQNLVSFPENALI